MKGGIVDFGIVINNRDFSEFDSYLIESGKFHLFRSPKYEGNWKKEGPLLTEMTKEVLSLKDKFYRRENKSLNEKMIISSWGVIKRLVIEGIGVGLLPDYLVKNDISEGVLKYVDKSKYSIDYQILLISQKGRYLPHRVKKVIELLT